MPLALARGISRQFSQTPRRSLAPKGTRAEIRYGTKLERPPCTTWRSLNAKSTSITVRTQSRGEVAAGIADSVSIALLQCR